LLEIGADPNYPAQVVSRRQSLLIGDGVAGDAAQSDNWGDDGKSENLYVDESQQLRVHK
jgi:hypothetical protein